MAGDNQNNRLQKTFDVSSFRRIIPLKIDQSILDFNTVQNFVPELRIVDPAVLYVDDRYQRKPTIASIKLVKKIIKNWSWESFKPPIVTEYDGLLYVIDGQHTAIAAVTHPEVYKIPVFIVNVEDVKAAAKAFIEHNTNRTTVNPIQLFKARLEAGEDDAISINMALQRSGVRLVSSILDQQEGVTTALGALNDVYEKYGVKCLRMVLDVCVASRLAPIQAYYIKALASLMFAPDYRDKFDYQGLALTIRDYPFHELVGDIESSSRRDKIKKDVLAIKLIRAKYISTFGNPDEPAQSNLAITSS
jgi:hypothetical protein